MSKKQKPVCVWVARDKNGAYNNCTFLYTSEPIVQEIAGLKFFQGHTDGCHIKGINLRKGQRKRMKLVEVKE